ncbi:ABC transporter permease [Dictyobacter arantiisoli]|uniref:ABC transporter permease n=1 Tax=Dictyobacter arantiisoli TaxID=2014874 RepID=A0A5A5TGP5_9CHLR|nr:ABC transporter permease [Dictyobacter arantiisoli]GCF10326.1 hypothetical protein KDI_38900 [Dictyobacter arantiisoli]
MSTIANSKLVTSAEERAQLRASTPSFFGLVRGELLKLSRRWSTWIPLVITLLFIAACMFLQTLRSGLKDYLTTDPLHALYGYSENGLGFTRAFIGLYLLILTAYVIGLEYQMGTIRVLISRGVGKLQLLAAKVTTIAIVAVLVLIVALILNVIMMGVVLIIGTGNLNALNSLTPQFWSDTLVSLSTILVSMLVTILLGTAASVLGRSLTIGLALGLAWFPVDNIGSQFFGLGYELSKNNFWLDATAYFLGPNLNRMAGAILPASLHVTAILFKPLVEVDGSHTLWVAAVYGAIFLAASILLTKFRDIKE